MKSRLRSSTQERRSGSSNLQIEKEHEESDGSRNDNNNTLTSILKVQKQLLESVKSLHTRLDKLESAVRHNELNYSNVHTATTIEEGVLYTIVAKKMHATFTA